jgi:CarboxypepD_reg-like domain/Secretion system C-terminal sorting domain
MQKIQLSIPAPCHQNWQHMSPTEQGRFCNACAKEVIDFSAMSDSEVLNFFTAATSKNVCGRTYPDQLDRIIQPPVPAKKIWYWNYVAMLLLFFSKSTETKAQIKGKIAVAPKPVPVYQQVMGIVALPTSSKPINQKIEGRIIDEKGNGIAFASIKIANKNTGTQADKNGYFTILANKNNDELECSAVGFEKSTIKLSTFSDATIVLKMLVHQMMGDIVMVGGISSRSFEEDEDAPSPDYHTINFTIKDNETFLPIEKTNITIVKIGEDKQKLLQADKNGNCKVKRLIENENYAITINADGFEDTTITINAGSLNKRKVQNDIFLTKKNDNPVYKNIEEVIVPANSSCSRMMGGLMSTIRVNRYQTTAAKIVTVLNDSLKVFPNPVLRGSSFTVALKFKAAGAYQIQITDAAGSGVLQQHFNSTSKNYTTTIQADNRWSTGIYNIRIFDNKNKLVSTNKLVVQ